MNNIEQLKSMLLKKKAKISLLKYEVEISGGLKPVNR